VDAVVVGEQDTRELTQTAIFSYPRVSWILASDSQLADALASIPGLSAACDELLAPHTRFAIGGPADYFVRSAEPEALAAAVEALDGAGVPWMALGEGSNVIVADAGYRGAIVRYLGNEVAAAENRVEAQCGAPLQSLVDTTIEAGLVGMHTLERIPGSVGGAVYGNAGAYGHQLDEMLLEARFLEDGEIRTFTNAECDFDYRESVFKRSKRRILLSCVLEMERSSAEELRREAAEIRRVRDEKFPPTMRCAGSIFKNLFLADLPEEIQALVPERAVRGGKVASAFFLEKVGAKGMERGGIRIADYHANLIWNEADGTAADLTWLIEELKRRVREQFGFAVEEEVQYIG